MIKRCFFLVVAAFASFFATELDVLANNLPQIKIEVERLPDMNMPRAGHAVFCADGELTVVGGHTSGFVLTPTAEYFSGGVWHVVPTVYKHDNGMAVVLNGGHKVLIAGGHDKNLGIGQSFEAEMYDRAKHTFVGFGCLDRSRALSQGVEMDSTHVLICGNHTGNDSFEMFDGNKFFRHVKAVSRWRSVPYVLPIADDDAIVFGTVWRYGRFEPCDTVDCLKGESFCMPLLKEWMPMVYDQNSHFEESFIGDRVKGDYSYLIAAKNFDGKVAFVRISHAGDDSHLPTFSLLPTISPVPMVSKWGRIKYDRVAIADRQAHRSYLVGNDSTGRVYVVAVEYDRCPAPLTLYYTDPLSPFGDTTPVLTPDGDLVVTGGIDNDNFNPFASVWLLHTGEREKTPVGGERRSMFWWWGFLGLTVAGVLVLLVVKRTNKTNRSNKTNMTVGTNRTVGMDSADDLEPQPQLIPGEQMVELMEHISKLMGERQLYLNPDLKVSDMAEALDAHRNAVSACINSQKGCTFNQFVNEYRIDHAKQLLLSAPDLKIAAVAIESGFANERSFFRAFKAATDLTPKEWTERHKDCQNSKTD